jgi:hypothetical protein
MFAEDMDHPVILTTDIRSGIPAANELVLVVELLDVLDDLLLVFGIEFDFNFAIGWYIEPVLNFVLWHFASSLL